MLYTQPQGGPIYADQNPLTRGLQIGVIPFLRTDSIRGKLWTQEGLYATSASPVGVGLVTDGAVSNIYLPIPPVTLTRWTMFGVFKSGSAMLDARAFALGSSTNSSPIIQIGTATGDMTKVRLFARDTPGNTVDGTSVASPFDGNIHTVGISYDGATLSCYVDGKFDSSVAGASFTFDVDRVCVGALYRSTAAVYWAGSTYVGAMWDRSLSALEHAQVASNPWQLFLDEDDYTDGLFYDAGGGVNSFSYTATGGMALAGTGSRFYTKTQTASGGLILAGTATIVPGAGTQSQTVTPSGGIVFAGLTPAARGVIKAATGGLLFGGSATITQFPDPTPVTVRAFKRGRRPRTRRY